MPDRVKKIFSDPEFIALEQRRSRFAWRLASVVLVAYFSFILVIAFAPSIFATVVPGFEYTTLGIPVGLAIIVLCFLLTGLYVRRANTDFDPALARILERYRATNVDARGNV